MNEYCIARMDDTTARDPELAGAKAANLATALAAGFPVLPGFVLTTEWTFDDLDAALEAHGCLSEHGSLPVVVRSSSTGEDGADSSMAGVFDSVTEVVGADAFVDAVNRVRASADVARCQGLVDAQMGILVQPMLAPRWGGVLFGADPVAGQRNRMMISAASGAPSALVSGEVDGWTALLDRSGRVRKVLATGHGEAAVPSSLLHRLASVATGLEALFGRPQDLEWAFDDELDVVLLQARPITSGGPASGPVFGPGPVAESFPDALSRLEQELWLDPMRDGLRDAIRLAGTRSRRSLERSRLVITVGGVAAADLEVMGVASSNSLLRRVDPRPPARRLRASWRVGRLRAAFPQLARDVVDEVDGHLSEVPRLQLLDQEDLLAIVRNGRAMLPGLHGYEALAGLLIPRADAGPTGSAVALQIVGEALVHGRPMQEVAEEEPAVLALLPPRIDADRTVASLSEVAPFDPPASLAPLEASTTLPTGVRDVLARRLARVSASCNNVLGACSVAGTEFDASVVGEVLAVPDAAVTDALEEAAATRLVAPLPTRPGGWEFVHALVRTARYEALGIAERAALHRRVVDALEGRPVPAAVLAHHAALARFEPGDPRPGRFAAAAGREALDRFAWDEAVVLWRRALEVTPPGANGDVLRAEAWLGLGDARLRSGDADGAAEAFAAAAAIGRAGGRPDLIGRAALGFGAGFGSFEVRLLDRRQLELLEEAVTALPGDSELRPLVLARLSVALSFVGSEERRLELANEAIALSRRAGDRRALAAALAARCDVLAGPDHTAERLGAATEGVALAQRADDLPLELLGRRLRVVALLELRDLIAFDAEVAAYARAAERSSDPLYAWWVPQWRAMRAYADGNTEQAADLAGEARAIGAASGSSNAEILGAVVGVFVAVDRRDAVELDAHWSHLLSKHPELFEQAAAAAMALLVDARFGRRDRLRAQLARFGTDGLERLPRDQEWLAALAQLVVAGVAAGERPFVARCYELLRPYAGLGVFEGAAAVDYGVVDRFLALAAGHTGDAEAARRHTHAALVEAAKSGRLALAHTQADCACALLLTGDEDDQRIGRELAQQAATAYEALGFTALATELSAPAGSGAAEPAGAPDAALVREGDTWAFTFDGTTVRVRHAKGIADLAVLLAQPGREVHVAMLEGAPGPDWRSAPQPRLDGTAVGQYRERLRELEEELDEADRHGDIVRAERLATERDALVDELTHAFGLGGRARDVASDANERLRKAVSARVKASIDRLEALDPALGRHLRNSVRTGFWCSYQPERPVSWTVTANRHG